jgi:hypothetical protein
LYYVPVLDEEALRSRFELIEIDGEGILLNVESGAFYRLNRTAYGVWAALIAGRPFGAVVDQLVRDFGITRGQAERDALVALEELPPGPPPLASSDRFRWAVLPAGYGFFVDGSLLFEVDAGGDSLRSRSGSPPNEEQAQLQLKAVLPKLLTLRGIRVLHAAAIEMRRSLLVFSGRSGAGKTTSARAFVDAGARLVSEDLLIFTPGAAARDAVLGGERIVRAWVEEEARRLADSPGRTIDCKTLACCLEGERLPVRQILLIEADRRVGDRIQVESLSRPDALLALLESAYFASADASSWRLTFESLRGLVMTVSTARAVMPKGLAALRAAVTAFDYSDMTAS